MSLSHYQPPKSARRISFFTGLLVLGLAAGCFALSFDALRKLASENGVEPTLAWIWPLILDGSIVVFSMCALRATLYGESPWRAMLLVVGATVASVAFNVAHAPAHTLARLIASVPPVLLFFSFEIFVSQIRSEVRKFAQITAPPSSGGRREETQEREYQERPVYREPALGNSGLNRAAQQDEEYALPSRQLPAWMTSEAAESEEDVEEYVHPDRSATPPIRPLVARSAMAPEAMDRVVEKSSRGESQQEKIKTRRQTVKKLHAAGTPDDEIAGQLGVRPQTIRRDLAALGLA